MTFKGKDVSDVLNKYTQWLLQHKHIEIDLKNINYTYDIRQYEAAEIQVIYEEVNK